MLRLAIIFKVNSVMVNYKIKKFIGLNGLFISLKKKNKLNL